MLDKETVIIIGAGVNKEINPSIDTGAELIQNISNRVTDRTSPNNKVLSKAFDYFPDLDVEVRTRFLLHLDHYIGSVSVPSIDAFMNEVDTYPEFRNDRDKLIRIGLLMILAHVTSWEGTTTVASLEAEVARKRKTWLTVLGDFIVQNNLFNRDRLKIVTFNYDRILEKFLHDAFGELAVEFITDNVYHVYGRIANLPGLQKIYDEENELDFDQIKNNDFKALQKFRDNIKLIRQKIDTTEIRDVVVGSKNLIIMGYSADPINNARIGLQQFMLNTHKREIFFNIYPGPFPNYNFNSRRDLADAVRQVDPNAEINYMGCIDFLTHALREVDK